MDLLVDFASTGQAGPLHCGMPLAGAEDLLGPGRPHPAIQLLGPDIDGYPYSWDALDLVITERHVSGIWIRLWPGSTVTLPPAVLPGAQSYSATVLREELIAALDTAGCRHEINSVLTFGEQSSLRTVPADVCAVFSLPRRNNDVPQRDGYYLDVLHKRAV